MPDKIILIAHHDTAVRDRFAAALSDARHTFVTASTAEAANAAARDEVRPISLAVVDVGLSEDGVSWIRGLRGDLTWPVIVFAGSVRSAADTRALLAVSVAGYINEHAPASQILPALAPYLFPASFDRRLSPRVPLGVPVSYRAGQTIATAVSLNLGRGGLAVRTLSPLDPGLLVELKFRLPGQSEIEVRGRVVWADRKAGMGVQFERVSPAHQRAIDALTGSR
ncbi:MAG: PilZ domain-containing protein [Vicinamibacterales bacterium]